MFVHTLYPVGYLEQLTVLDSDSIHHLILSVRNKASCASVGWQQQRNKGSLALGK